MARYRQTATNQKLPDVMTPQQVALLISITRQRRYQMFFLTLYTMGLRLSEGLNLTIHDIDSLNTTARYTRMTQIKQRDAALAVNQLADALTLMWEEA